MVSSAALRAALSIWGYLHSRAELGRELERDTHVVLAAGGGGAVEVALAVDGQPVRACALLQVNL